METRDVLLYVGCMFVGSIVIGVTVGWAGRQRHGIEWLMAGMGALVGGSIASEKMGRLSNWGIESVGVRVLPALIGAVLIGGLGWAYARYAVRRPANPS